MSWAAIAQIESGRRQEVRLGSLVALANALRVSVDYLVGSGATVSAKLLEHRALIYDSDDQYLAVAGPFLVEGVRRSDSVLVVTARQKIGLLREALGDDAMQVEFVDSAEWYRSPTDLLHHYRTFVRERFERGAHWIRIIGEPVWAGLSEAEIDVWTRCESMVNLAFSSWPATVMCPYDAISAPEGVLVGARQTHPEVAEDGDATASLAYREPEDFLLSLP